MLFEMKDKLLTNSELINSDMAVCAGMSDKDEAFDENCVALHNVCAPLCEYQSLLPEAVWAKIAKSCRPSIVATIEKGLHACTTKNLPIGEALRKLIDESCVAFSLDQQFDSLKAIAASVQSASAAAAAEMTIIEKMQWLKVNIASLEQPGIAELNTFFSKVIVSQLQGEHERLPAECALALSKNIDNCWVAADYEEIKQHLVGQSQLLCSIANILQPTSSASKLSNAWQCVLDMKAAVAAFVALGDTVPTRVAADENNADGEHPWPALMQMAKQVKATEELLAIVPADFDEQAHALAKSEMTLAARHIEDAANVIEAEEGEVGHCPRESCQDSAVC